MHVCDRKCVILQTKRAGKEILDLLNEEEFLEIAVVELVYKLSVVSD